MGALPKSRTYEVGPPAGSMRPRSRPHQARRPSRRHLSRSLSRPAENLLSHRPLLSQKQPRRTVKSLPALKKPLSRCKPPSAQAYLAEVVCSEASSATVTATLTRQADIPSFAVSPRDESRSDPSKPAGLQARRALW